MRLVLYIMVIALLQSGGAKEPFKRCDKIVVTSTKTYPEIMATLFDKGFSIEFSDKDSGIIQTKTLSEKRFYISLKIRLDNGKIHVQGKYSIDDDSMSTVDFRGMKGSPAKLAFLKMDEIAKSIGDNARYFKID